MYAREIFTQLPTGGAIESNSHLISYIPRKQHIHVCPGSSPPDAQNLTMMLGPPGNYPLCDAFPWCVQAEIWFHPSA